MEGSNSIAAVIAAFGPAIGAATSSGQVISKTIEPMIHQLETSGQLRTTMFIGVVLIKAVSILGVVVSLLLLSR